MDAIDLVTDSSKDTLYELEENVTEDDNGYTISKKIKEKALEGNTILLNDADDIYVLTKQAFDKISDIRVKQLIQEIFIKNFQQEIEKIENFKKVKKTISFYNKLGLFQSETNIDISSQEFVKKTIS